LPRRGTRKFLIESQFRNPNSEGNPQSSEALCKGEAEFIKSWDAATPWQSKRRIPLSARLVKPGVKDLSCSKPT